MSQPPQSNRFDGLLRSDLVRGYPEHIKGHKVSASTYGKHRCRCYGCTKAASAKSTEWKRRSGKMSPFPKRLPSGPLAKARKQEWYRRRNMAVERALRALRDLHRAEYDEIHARIAAEIREAEGPLPGDDWYQSRRS